MKDFVDKVQEVIQTIPNKLGEFNLLALFEQEDYYNHYDLVMSTELNGGNKHDLFSVIHAAFKAKMTPEELSRFSRFVYLKPDEPFVQGLNEKYPIQNGRIDIRDYRFNNNEIKRGYIFTSQGHLVSS